MKNLVPESLDWTPELVDKFWNGFAQTELTDLAFGKLAGPEFVRVIEPYLSKSLEILDFGCGNGEFVEYLVNLGYAATGFEPSVDRKQALLNRFVNKPNFRGVIDSQGENKFDVVIAMEVVEHILESDFQSTISRLIGFVKPGGTLIVSTPNNENLKYAKVYCPVSNKVYHPWQHVRSFSGKHIDQLFSAYGVSRVRLSAIDFSSDAYVYEKNKAYEGALVELKNYQQEIKKLFDELVDGVNNSSRVNLIDRSYSWLKARGKLQGIIKKLSIENTRLNNLVDRANSLSTSFSFDYRTVDMPRGDSDFDIVIGRGTTIVYVGTKCVE